MDSEGDLEEEFSSAQRHTQQPPKRFHGSDDKYVHVFDHWF